MCDKGPSSLQLAMATMMQAFDEYAAKEGDPQKLSKRELKELLENEMGLMAKGAKCPDKLEEMFKCMDADQSGEVDFTEFMTAMACFTCFCHGKACQKPQCKK